MQKVDLSKYNNEWYRPGAGAFKRLLWYLVNARFLDSWFPLPYGFKIALLRTFGASISNGVVIKPKVNIKYPWNLEVGENAWIGEGVWIDNLDKVKIGANACISQGALIMSGNHDYTKSTFDLMIKPIEIGEGAWVGARATVAQGVKMGAHAVLVSGSVASSDLDAFGIYRGNPAVKVKEREIVS